MYKTTAINQAIIFTFIGFLLISTSNILFAEDTKSSTKNSKLNLQTESGKTELEKSVEQDAIKGVEQLKEKESKDLKEKYRDKSHDNRVKVNSKVSIGGKLKEGGGEINIKATEVDLDPTDK